jgi:hypothetical protein
VLEVGNVGNNRGARPEYYCDAGVAAIIIIFESGVIGDSGTSVGVSGVLGLMTTDLLRPANVCRGTRRQRRLHFAHTVESEG